MKMEANRCRHSALTYHFSVEAGRGSVKGYAADFHIGAEKYAGEDHKVSVAECLRLGNQLEGRERVRVPKDKTDEKQLHGTSGDAIADIDY